MLLPLGPTLSDYPDSGQSLMALFTARISSLMVMRPSSLPSPAEQALISALPSAIFTILTNSLIDTTLSPLQSPAQTIDGVCVCEGGVALCVGVPVWVPVRAGDRVPVPVGVPVVVAVAIGDSVNVAVASRVPVRVGVRVAVRDGEAVCVGVRVVVLVLVAELVRVGVDVAAGEPVAVTVGVATGPWPCKNPPRSTYGAPCSLVVSGCPEMPR